MKPGIRTTEFWITVATGAGSLIASASGWLPPRYAAVATAVSGAAYALARGLAKLQAPKP